MLRPAFRKKKRAIRNACYLGLCLIVLLLLLDAADGAGPTVTLVLSSLAALSLVCLGVAHRQSVARHDADDLIQRLSHESDERSGQLAVATQRYVDTLDRMLAGCQLIGFDWRYLYVNEAVTRQGRKDRTDLLGRTMMECYPGIENTPAFAVFRQCMEKRTLEYMENEFSYPDGSTGWFQLSIQPVPEGIFIVSIEITERKHAEMETQRQIERLESLRAIDVAILGTVDLPLTLKTILNEAQARLQFDGADIRFLNPDTLALDLAAAIGSHQDRWGATSIRLGEGIVGSAARAGRTVSVADTASGEPAAQGMMLPGAARAVYATPLTAKGNLIGVFTASFRAPFVADDDWIDFFETVAGQTSMAIESGKMFNELQRSHLDLKLAYDTTIEGWSRALDLRDKETEGHTQRVTELTVKLARKAGMSDAELVHVRWGALLHDIGKMGVPDAILLKPDKLTADEWDHMRKHPVFAYELLKPIEYLRDALDIPLYHHEKWDGTGYPRGLKGEQIPLAARLFAVVDVWDAIRSDRPYRAGWPEPRALDYICSVAGAHLDPEAVALFLRVHAEESVTQPAEPLVHR